MSKKSSRTFSFFTFLLIQVNFKFEEALPLYQSNDLVRNKSITGVSNSTVNSVESNRCQTLDETLRKIKEIIQTTTNGNRDDLIYKKDTSNSNDKKNVVSSIKFSIARSNRQTCKIEIKINQTTKFEFFDIFVLNQTLRYFLLNSLENKIFLKDRVFFIFNFNYCNSIKYYSIKLSESELHTVDVLDKTLSKHSKIINENCKNANFFKTYARFSSSHFSSLNKPLSFRPNLIQKNLNGILNESNNLSTEQVNHEDETNESSNEKNLAQNLSSGGVVKESNKTSYSEDEIKFQSFYFITTKILVYLIIVFFVFFVINFLLKLNKYYFQNKFKEKIIYNKVIQNRRFFGKKAANCSLSGTSLSNSIYFNPFDLTAINVNNGVTGSNNNNIENIYNKACNLKTDDNSQKNDMIDFFFSQGRLQQQPESINVQKNFNNKRKKNSVRLFKSYFYHDDLIKKNEINVNINTSYSNEKNKSCVNIANTYYEHPDVIENSEALNAEQQLEGDKRSEHSITDYEKMKYVEEWLNSISLVKYFLVNTMNYDNCYRPHNFKRSKWGYRSANL